MISIKPTLNNFFKAFAYSYFRWAFQYGDVGWGFLAVLGSRAKDNSTLRLRRQTESRSYVFEHHLAGHSQHLHTEKPKYMNKAEAFKNSSEQFV